MDKPSFVSLDRLTQGVKDPKGALAEIRRIYFATTRRTIEHDLAHAIELLMSLPTEEDREKATVFMHGLDEMRREWAKKVTTDGSPKVKRPSRPGPPVKKSK